MYVLRRRPSLTARKPAGDQAVMGSTPLRPSKVCQGEPCTAEKQGRTKKIKNASKNLRPISLCFGVTDGT